MGVNGLRQWLCQFVALTQKNFLLMRRNKFGTFFELAAPLIMMIMLGEFDKAFKYESPSVNPSAFASLSSGGTPPTGCYVFDDAKGRFGEGYQIPLAWCVPLIFAPTTSADVLHVMGIVASRNGYESPVTYVGDNSPNTAPEESCSDVSRCMLGFETVAQMQQWHLNNFGRTAAAVVFGDTMESDESTGVWDEGLQRYV